MVLWVVNILCIFFSFFYLSIWDFMRSLTHIWIAWICFVKYIYKMITVFLSYCVCAWERVTCFRMPILILFPHYNLQNTSISNYGHTLKVNQRHKWRRDDLPMCTLLPYTSQVVGALTFCCHSSLLDTCIRVVYDEVCS